MKTPHTFNATATDKKFEASDVFCNIKTNSHLMYSIFQYIQTIANSKEPVLITGETGVGKELIAKAIHACGILKGKMVTVNVAGLDDNVFSDTLFGHARGAFTGAEKERPGLIEKASGGTLFLDEIGDLSISSQVKLLRLLQEGEYLPLGLDEVKKTDVRIIAATNEDLWKLQRDGKFRKDLNFRLRTHHITIPPLRDRKDDIPVLLNHFIKEASHTLGKQTPSVDNKIFPILRDYAFPGNVREMKSLVFDILSRCSSNIISQNEIQNYISPKQDTNPIISNGESPVIFGNELPTLKEASQMLVEEAMKRANGKQAVAAKMLGISIQALNKRLKKTTPSST